jgi:hypothetical protein
MEERSNVNSAQRGAEFLRGKGGFVEYVRIEKESIIAWSMGILARFIWIRSRRNLFSMYSLPPLLFLWQQRDVISSASFARIGRFPRPLRRMYLVMMFHRRWW